MLKPLKLMKSYPIKNTPKLIYSYRNLNTISFFFNKKNLFKSADLILQKYFIYYNFIVFLKKVKKSVKVVVNFYKISHLFSNKFHYLFFFRKHFFKKYLYLNFIEKNLFFKKLESFFFFLL